MGRKINVNITLLISIIIVSLILLQNAAALTYPVETEEYQSSYKLLCSNDRATVYTNLQGAQVTIRGPPYTKLYPFGKMATSHSGTTSSLSGSYWYWYKNNLASGNWTVSYGEMSGFETPQSETKALVDGGCIYFTGTYTSLNDIDKDGISDDKDNCPSKFNPDQKDSDGDGKGDLCDLVVAPVIPNEDSDEIRKPSEKTNSDPLDLDSDGIENIIDNCIYTSNVDQEDGDGDGFGDACDNCPSVNNSNKKDSDSDGVGDVCDNCVYIYNVNQEDGDGDGYGDACDNCPKKFNLDQKDSDGDGKGDLCDLAVALVIPNEDSDEIKKPEERTNYEFLDLDSDGIENVIDNCIYISNINQDDSDGDGFGDACDNCPGVKNSDINDFLDFDEDGVGNLCDNCIYIHNINQEDGDGDGYGDACDNCPSVINSGLYMHDSDGDGKGDICDIPEGKVRVFGFINYVDKNNGLKHTKPVRYASVTLKDRGSDKKFTISTDSTGYFTFIISKPSNPKAYKIIVKPYHTAVKVYKDLDLCNQYVRWRKYITVSNTENFLDLGDLTIDDDSNIDLECVWSEGGGTCGSAADVKIIQGGSVYMNIFDTVLLGWEYAINNRDDDDSIGTVWVEYPEDTITGTSWSNPFFDEIYLIESNGWSDSTILHEYAHHLSDEISENDWAVADHTLCSSVDRFAINYLNPSEFAWFEGFAEYYGTFLTNKYSGDPHFLSQKYTKRSEFPETPTCGELHKGKEGAVFAALWDLADYSDNPLSTNESFDTIGGGGNEIFQIFDNELDNLADAPGICQFQSAWKDRFTGSKDQAIDAIFHEYNIDCG